MTTQPTSRCNQKVFQEGESVFVLHSLPSTAIEAIVVRLREELNYKDIDWHYCGGRANILVLPSKGKRGKTIAAEVIDRLRYLTSPVGYVSGS